MQRKRPSGPPRARRAQPVRQDPFEDEQPFDADGAYGAAPYGEPYEEATYKDGAYADAPYEEQPYEETAYDDAPYGEATYEEVYEEPVRTGRAPQPEVIATNTAIRLTCTLCAMMGLLAIFMCWAERESRAIRHFAVQSAAITVLHLFSAALLFLIAGLMGGIPFLGFLLTMVCWLIYFALLVVIIVVRARMMLHAWRGIRFTIPGLWRTLERFV